MLAPTSEEFLRTNLQTDQRLAQQAYWVSFQVFCVSSKPALMFCFVWEGVGGGQASGKQFQPLSSEWASRSTQQ